MSTYNDGSAKGKGLVCSDGAQINSWFEKAPFHFLPGEYQVNKFFKVKFYCLRSILYGVIPSEIIF